MKDSKKEAKLPKNKKDDAIIKFLKEDFDDMIKFADWQKGKDFKELILKALKK